MLSKEELSQLLELLAANTYTSYLILMNYLSKKRQKKYFDLMSCPKVGDLVLEISHLGRSRDIIDRVGCLLSISGEPYPDCDNKGPVKNSEIWTIETFDGRQVRWENPAFIAIPRQPIDIKIKKMDETI